MNKNILIGLVLIAAAAGGYYQFSVKPAQEAAAGAAEDAAAEAKAAEEAAAAAAKQAAAGAGEWELVLYTTEAIGDGQHANNPWLQELPDAISKATWDNYALMSMAKVRFAVIGLGVTQPKSQRRLD